MGSKLFCLILALSIISCAPYKYKDKRIKEISASGITSLEIISRIGDLDVKGISGYGSIKAVASLSLFTEDKMEAKDLIKDKLVLSITKKGSRAIMELDYKNLFIMFWDHARVDVEVYLPSNVKLEVEENGADLYVENIRAETLINDNFGSINLNGLSGNIDIKDFFGPILIKNSSGKISIKDSPGIIKIEKSQAGIRIKDGFGLIQLENITGNIDIDDGPGDIYAYNISGDILIANAGLGKVKLRKVSGDIIKN